MGALYLEGALGAEPVNLFAEEFLAKLSTFNELSRKVRDAGIEIKQLELLENRIFIEQDSVERFLQRFEYQLQKIRYLPAGPFTCNAVTVRGVEVAWFTLVKEQDK
ncbi:hypothetical protein ACM1ZW_20935 [Pseudomonas sp. NFX71]|uniref:hypothetical protein n=1 Tax=Pseudomonas sp. NFX71 TaxID=3399121 RepID=UPI003A89419E